MTALSKMKFSNRKIQKIKQGQMQGYFRGDNVESADKKWGVDSSDADGMGFLDDWMKDIEKSVDDWSKDVLPENVKAGIDKALKKESDKAVAKVTQQATTAAKNLITQQAKKPENQDKAIASTIQATAEKATQTAQDVADAMRTGGIMEVYKRYPIPFYVAGGLVGLMTLKWGLNQVGAGKAKAVLSKANPKRKRRVRRKRK